MRDDEVRYCPPEEMPHLVAAYEQITLPRVRQRFSARGMTVFAVTASTESLVVGAPNRPVRSMADGRTRLVRNHRAGTVSALDAARLDTLLDTFDVVCLSAPVAANDGGGPLNVDADVLAAELARALTADHLRLVTGTAGLLTDPADPHSTLPCVRSGHAMEFARGRMRQKVRAAELALSGATDVAITGPHTVGTRGGTRFWRAPPPAPDLGLLARMVEISSVSGDERELAEFLLEWCRERGVTAELDEAGNLVASRGTGVRRLLMIGHLDTVPFRWPVHWDGNVLSGRGCVDAKASLAAFLETLAVLDVAPDAMVRVIGTVEEERTAAGAFFVRDHYPADAVIVGEPSGIDAVTLGYHGVCKTRLSLSQPATHTAGRAARTAGSRIIDAVNAVEAGIRGFSPDALFAVLSLQAGSAAGTQTGEAVIDVRVPPQTDVADLVALIGRLVADPVRADVLLQTPAVLTAWTDPLVRAFTRAMRGATGKAPRMLSKKGSSDMNTLATTWRDVPMLAYGPGDAALDHTPHERLDAADYRQARAILRDAVMGWLGGGRATGNGAGPAHADCRIDRASATTRVGAL
jgi:LysW-gamma-L-lysine carboxypeptidase